MLFYGQMIVLVEIILLYVCVHVSPTHPRSSTTSAVPCCATTSATQWSTTARRAFGTSWRCPAGPRWFYWAPGATSSFPWWAKATATSWRSSPTSPSATTGSWACWRSTASRSSCWETPCLPASCLFLGKLPWMTAAKDWPSQTLGITGFWWCPPLVSCCTS